MQLGRHAGVDEIECAVGESDDGGACGGVCDELRLALLAPVAEMIVRSAKSNCDNGPPLRYHAHDRGASRYGIRSRGHAMVHATLHASHVSSGLRVTRQAPPRMGLGGARLPGRPARRACRRGGPGLPRCQRYRSFLPLILADERQNIPSRRLSPRLFLSSSQR